MIYIALNRSFRFEQTAALRKTALNDSNRSEDTPTSGPNASTSSSKWTRRCSFTFRRILSGNSREKPSRKLAVASRKFRKYRSICLICVNHTSEVNLPRSNQAVNRSSLIRRPSRTNAPSCTIFRKWRPMSEFGYWPMYAVWDVGGPTIELCEALLRLATKRLRSPLERDVKVLCQRYLMTPRRKVCRSSIGVSCDGSKPGSKRVLSSSSSLCSSRAPRAADFLSSRTSWSPSVTLASTASDSFPLTPVCFWHSLTSPRGPKMDDTPWRRRASTLSSLTRFLHPLWSLLARSYTIRLY